MLEQARTVIRKSKERFSEAEKYIQELSPLADSAEGDRRKMLEQDIASLERLKDEAAAMYEDLSVRIRKEEKKIELDERKRDVMLENLERASELIEEASILTGQWKVSEVEKRLDEAQKRVSQTETYIKKEGERIPRIMNPRKKQLAKYVYNVKRRKISVSEKLEEEQAAFKDQKLKAEEEIRMSKKMEESHGELLRSVKIAESLIKAGEFDGAEELLEQAEESFGKIKEYFDKLSTRGFGKGNKEQKSWVEQTKGRLVMVIRHEEDKIASARNMLFKEQEISNRDQKEYGAHIAALNDIIDISDKALHSLEKGNDNVSREWLKEEGAIIRAADIYCEKMIQDLHDRGYKEKDPRAVRIRGREQNIRSIMSKTGSIENKIREMLGRIEDMRKNEERKKEDILNNISESNILLEKAGKAANNEDVIAVKTYIQDLEKNMNPVDEYLKGLAPVIEKASGVRKLKLSMVKLEVEKNSREIKKAAEQIRERIIILEAKPFHKSVRDFALYSGSVRPAGVHNKLIKPGTDPLKIHEEIDYIAFFRNIFKEKKEDIKSEAVFDYSLEAAIALMDLGDYDQKYIKTLKWTLTDPRCKKEQKAAIYAALFRHNIEPVKNYRNLMSLSRENPSDKKVHIIVSGLFLEMGISVPEQLEFFNGLLELSDEEYDKEGFTVYDEVKISSFMLFNGIDVDEGLEWFNEILQEIENMAADKKSDTTLKALVYYALVKYSLISKYEPVREKNLAREELLEAADKAKQVGLEVPTNVNTRYTLIVPTDIFNNGDLDKYEKEYADRINIKTIGAQSGVKFVNRVLAFAGRAGKGPDKNDHVDNTNIVVLVPSNAPEEKLRQLIDNEIRFVRIEQKTIYDAKACDDKGREIFHRNTFAIMILSRLLDRDKLNEPYMRRIMEVYEFYVKSHFDLDGVTPQDFVRAVAEGDLAVIVKGLLILMPMEKYDIPEYDIVQEALRSA